MEEIFGPIIGVIFLIVVALLFISYFPGTFMILVLIAGGIVGVIFLLKEAKAAKARREAEDARQREYQAQLLSACSDSIAAFENIPKHLMTAEELLDIAEAEFQDGAFSPFWDSIERAMKKLGDIDGSIKLITQRSNKYKELIKSYKGHPPPFPVDAASAHRVGAAGNTAGRLQKIVRGAQRNFQFATIYEQRKTSEILIAGFTNLGEAIHGLGIRLEESICALGDQISDLSSSMVEMNEKMLGAVQGVTAAVNNVSSQVGDVSSAVRAVNSGVTNMSTRVGDVSSAITSADANAQRAMTEQAARQEVANKMLDNIQRRRVPPPLSQH